MKRLKIIGGVLMVVALTGVVVYVTGLDIRITYLAKQLNQQIQQHRKDVDLRSMSTEERDAEIARMNYLEKRYAEYCNDQHLVVGINEKGESACVAPDPVTVIAKCEPGQVPVRMKTGRNSYANRDKDPIVECLDKKE